jgi:hypothetical protein
MEGLKMDAANENESSLIAHTSFEIGVNGV